MLLYGPLFLVLLTVLAAARWAAARSLGMRDVGFFLGGWVEGPAAAPWRRALVVLAGVAATYLVPALLFTAALVGGGRAEAPAEVQVLPGRPAEAAGMRTGDRVRSVGGKPVASFDELKKEILEHAGTPVEVVVARGADEARLTVTPEGPPGAGKIGVAQRGALRRVPVGLGEALGTGLAMPAAVIRDVAKGLAGVLAGSTQGEVSGPVAIVRETAKASQQGASDVLTLVAALFAYVWPLAAIAAVATVPRLRPKPRP